MDLTFENIENVFKEHPKFTVIKNLFNISKHEQKILKYYLKNLNIPNVLMLKDACNQKQIKKI